MAVTRIGIVLCLAATGLAFAEYGPNLLEDADLEEGDGAPRAWTLNLSFPETHGGVWGSESLSRAKTGRENAWLGSRVACC